MTEAPRKPRAVRLDQTARTGTANPAPAPAAPKQPQRKPRSQKNLAQLTLISDEAAQASAQLHDENLADTLTPPPAITPNKRFSFAGLLIFAIGGLMSLGIGLSIDQLISELFTRNTWLGWLASGLTLIVVLAVLAIAIREIIGLRRLQQIETMRLKAKELLQASDQRRAGKLVDQLMDIYGSRPDMARARIKMERYHGEIIDGPDLIKLAERDLLRPLDTRARELVLNASKRVSVVTAISPRALVDIAYVAIENLRVIRQLSELYGGRPGMLGMARLARNVIGHLAITGSIAIGDGIIQQFIGQGLAARLSSRLGEGVVNGLLTARVGISAIDLCRPLPFAAEKRPGIGDFINDLVALSGDEK